MNKLVIGLVIILVILGGFFLINSQTSDDETNSETTNSTNTNNENEGNIPFAGEAYEISTEESSVNWAGRKTLIPNYTDKGTLAFQAGEFFVDGEVVTGGRAVFDMNSIKAVKTTIGKESDLDKHLKSEDFFAVKTYPTAELRINQVSDAVADGTVTMTGTMTIKGIEQAVSFPATVNVEGDRVVITGETVLDRTLWDIRFGSDKFFDDLADNVIDDNFTVEFNVVATR